MFISKELLDNLSKNARINPRLRVNTCLHNSVNDKVQRLFNAMEPGTYVPVHRHTEASESMILVRGKMRVIFYDDQRRIKEEHVIEAGGDIIGVHVPNGTWHNVEVLEAGTIMFEVKEGPYSPLETKDIII